MFIARVHDGGIARRARGGGGRAGVAVAATPRSGDGRARWRSARLRPRAWPPVSVRLLVRWRYGHGRRRGPPDLAGASGALRHRGAAGVLRALAAADRRDRSWSRPAIAALVYALMCAVDAARRPRRVAAGRSRSCRATGPVPTAVDAPPSTRHHLRAISASRSMPAVGRRVEHRRPLGPRRRCSDSGSPGEPVAQPAQRHRRRQRVQQQVLAEHVAVVGDVGAAALIGVGQFVDVLDRDRSSCTAWTISTGDARRRGAELDAVEDVSEPRGCRGSAPAAGRPDCPCPCGSAAAPRRAVVIRSMPAASPCPRRWRAR